MDLERELALLKLSLLKLEHQEQNFRIDIANLKRQIAHFEKAINAGQKTIHQDTANEQISTQTTSATVETNLPKEAPIASAVPKTPPVYHVPLPKKKQTIANQGIENFIGGNLISKIGILVLVIGVVIGSKYAIDHNLISPTLRIIIGYCISSALLFTAYKLKSKYENFSAVLLSGAMASFYFVTYAAFNYYNMFSTTIAFLLMLLFTIFTVLAALLYNKEIIALFGMVGAYAIPLLVGEDTGSPIVLMSYISIINCGIYYLLLRKDWKWMFGSASIVTWIFFLVWITTHSMYEKRIILLGFGVLFYLQMLAALYIKTYKTNNKLQAYQLTLLLIHTLFYTIIGLILSYSINDHDVRAYFLLVNIILYCALGYGYIKKQVVPINYKALFTFAVIHLTIIGPVVFENVYLTAFLVLEALLLTLLFKKFKASFLLYLSLCVLALSIFSLLNIWSTYPQLYITIPGQIPLINKLGAVSILVAICIYLQYKIIITSSFNETKPPQVSLEYAQFYPLVSIGILFITGYLEVTNYIKNIAFTNELGIVVSAADKPFYVNHYEDHHLFICQILYALSFIALLNGVMKFMKHRAFHINGIHVINIVMVIIFLAGGLYSISELRDEYLSAEVVYLPAKSNLWLIWRYIALGLVTVILLFNYYWVKRMPYQKEFTKFNEIFTSMVVLWVLSSELIQWVTMAGAENTYKLGLSILWGIFALIMIYRGIFKGKKHFRLVAFVLLGITLLKLFTYDLSRLNTISKTVIFIILGVILLLVSYLYNKYKSKINPET